MTCLDESALLRVHWGDATDAERAHAAGCPTCAQALTAVASDLGRIDAVLREGVAMRRTPQPLPLRLAPFAAAALLVLALLLGRLRTTPVTADDTLAMLDELTAAVATYDVMDLALDEGTDAVADTQSTCAWGEPFLGMGCDEPPVTLVAWR
jgi:hypothetical protein